MAEQPDVEPTTVRDRWPAGSYLCASVERWGRLGHHIEREPKSPISRGRLCPKGSDGFELLTHSKRVTKVKYRRAYLQGTGRVVYRSGRGGATTSPNDLLNSDAILILGSNKRRIIRSDSNG
jgi:anaerobic selenocysteine-containing dehydrogenase